MVHWELSSVGSVRAELQYFCRNTSAVFFILFGILVILNHCTGSMCFSEFFHGLFCWTGSTGRTHKAACYPFSFFLSGIMDKREHEDSQHKELLPFPVKLSLFMHQHLLGSALLLLALICIAALK